MTNVKNCSNIALHTQALVAIMPEYKNTWPHLDAAMLGKACLFSGSSSQDFFGPKWTLNLRSFAYKAYPIPSSYNPSFLHFVYLFGGKIWWKCMMKQACISVQYNLHLKAKKILFNALKLDTVNEWKAGAHSFTV